MFFVEMNHFKETYLVSISNRALKAAVFVKDMFMWKCLYLTTETVFVVPLMILNSTNVLLLWDYNLVQSRYNYLFLTLISK